MNGSFPKITHLVKVIKWETNLSCTFPATSSSPNSQTILLMLTPTALTLLLLCMSPWSLTHQQQSYKHVVQYHAWTLQLTTCHHPQDQQRCRQSCSSCSFSNNASKDISWPLCSHKIYMLFLIKYKKYGQEVRCYCGEMCEVQLTDIDCSCNETTILVFFFCGGGFFCLFLF